MTRVAENRVVWALVASATAVACAHVTGTGRRRAGSDLTPGQQEAIADAVLSRQRVDWKADPFCVAVATADTSRGWRNPDERVLAKLRRGYPDVRGAEDCERGMLVLLMQPLDRPHGSPGALAGDWGPVSLCSYELHAAPGPDRWSALALPCPCKAPRLPEACAFRR